MTDSFTDHLPYLNRYLAAHYGRLTDADRDDIVQTVSTAVAKRILADAGFIPDCGWPTYLTRVAINLASKLLKKLERGWFQALADEACGPVAAPVESDAIAGEVVRRSRQTLLLSDILREYVTRCEEKRMQTQKEVYERRLRGQEPSLIATEMGISVDNVYQHLKRARDWIMERIRQADVDRTVFQTFLRPHKDVPAPTKLPENVPKNFNEVLTIVVDEAGALCPSDARLLQYRMTPQHADLSDVHYHVEQAKCPLCPVR